MNSSLTPVNTSLSPQHTALTHRYTALTNHYCDLTQESKPHSVSVEKPLQFGVAFLDRMFCCLSSCSIKSRFSSENKGGEVKTDGNLTLLISTLTEKVAFIQ